MNSSGWALVLVALGLSLMVAEVFIPSGGLIGIVAIALVVWGVWLAFQGSFAAGATALLAVLVLAPVVVGVAFQLWPKTPAGRKMILRPPSAEDSDGDQRHRPLDHLIGRTGTAATPLRPSGRVTCEGRSYDSLAETGLIDAGRPVVIIGARSGELIVREATT